LIEIFMENEIGNWLVYLSRSYGLSGEHGYIFICYMSIDD
jgi:hypothetical protein